MSRTHYVDLKTSRRSRRLQKKGYYLPPFGERVQPEDSSEEDEDVESVHSNNSSIYSKRTVHYGGTTTIPSVHKKRRSRGAGSPRQGGILVHRNSLSPMDSRRRLHMAAAEASSSKSTPNLSISKRDEVSASVSNHALSTKETKTTITAFRHKNRRRSRGESSTAVERRTVAQNQNVTIAQHDVTMTRNQSRYDAIGGGDQIMIQSPMETTNVDLQTSLPSWETNGVAAECTGSSNTTSHQRKSRYSSGSEDQNMVLRRKHDYRETSLASLLSKLYVAVWMLLSWIGACVGSVCETIYKTTLAVFTFDVRWLSQWASPLLAKAARYLLLILLSLLLLSSVYLVGSQFVSDHGHAAVLPIQSVAGLFQMLSQKMRTFAAYYQGQDKIFTEGLSETQSSHASNQDFEAVLINAELNFADRLAEINREMTRMRQAQQEFNTRQMKLTESQDQALLKLAALQNEVDSIDLSRSKSGDAIRAEIEDLRTLLADKSHAAVKISEFSSKMTAFDARLNSMNDLVMNSVKTFDLHIGNTSYIKEVAKMQFIESFLNVLKTTQGSAEDKNQLHFLFVAWLNKQGFAKIEEVDGDIKRLEETHDQSVTALEKKFATHFERIRHQARHNSPSITLERIVERPLKLDDTVKVGMEADVRQWVQDELAIYSADRIALADHALESAGGYVVNTRCSESYNRKTALVSLFGIPIYYNMNTPRSVIQPSTLPGECWSFKGSEGFLVVAISGAVRPTSFTLEHIPRELSPHGRIDSAPKDFKVLGLADAQDYEGVLLGKYRYEYDGSVIQQFAVTADNKKHFSHIELRVTSNWGHPKYTCLYRFRVHGERRSVEPPPS